MHDIRFIRENPAAFDAGLARRGAAPLSAEILALDEQSRAIKTQLQVGQARRRAHQRVGALDAQLRAEHVALEHRPQVVAATPRQERRQAGQGARRVGGRDRDRMPAVDEPAAPGGEKRSVNRVPIERGCVVRTKMPMSEMLRIEA